MLYRSHYESPLGGMTLASDGKALTGLWFDGQKYFAAGLARECAERELPVFVETKAWLDVYLSGTAPDFTPPLALNGSPFRKLVWNSLLAVPYGQTVAYGTIAARLTAETGKRVSARAVGSAVGRNPISLIVPCHRVVGKDGGLTGYAGGIEKKRALLEVEGATD